MQYNTGKALQRYSDIHPAATDNISEAGQPFLVGLYPFAWRSISKLTGRSQRQVTRAICYAQVRVGG
jgi:hypothetical protein